MATEDKDNTEPAKVEDKPALADDASAEPVTLGEADDIPFFVKEEEEAAAAEAKTADDDKAAAADASKDELKVEEPKADEPAKAEAKPAGEGEQTPQQKLDAIREKREKFQRAAEEERAKREGEARIKELEAKAARLAEIEALREKDPVAAARLATGKDIDDLVEIHVNKGKDEPAKDPVQERIEALERKIAEQEAKAKEAEEKAAKERERTTVEERRKAGIKILGDWLGEDPDRYEQLSADKAPEHVHREFSEYVSHHRLHFKDDDEAKEFFQVWADDQEAAALERAAKLTATKKFQSRAQRSDTSPAAEKGTTKNGATPAVSARMGKGAPPPKDEDTEELDPMKRAEFFASRIPFISKEN